MDAVLAALREELFEVSKEIPRVEQIADQVSEGLRAEEEQAMRLGGLVAAAARDAREQEAEIAALDERLAALREDRARYDDAIRLRELGSLTPLAVTRSLCPTCEQHLPATLLGADVGPVMTLEENRQLIDEERKTFNAMRDDAAGVLVATRQRLIALRRELDDVRRNIRALKSTLTQNAKAPSRAAIARQLRLGDRIEKLEQLDEALAGLESDLGGVATEFAQVTADLRRVGAAGGPTDDDREKLAAFGAIIREQLAEYGFQSVPPDEVHLSPDGYLPERNGEPLRPDELSASDRVRMVWAYVVGLLEMSRRFDTAHPGLLILDEPGQQDINDVSLRGLFRRLADADGHGQQVIVATSKPAARVREFIEGVDASIVEIRGYALTPQGR